MTSATTVDRSEFRHILLSGTIVGAVTGAAVVLFLLVSRSGLLPAGIVTSFLLMLIVLAGGVAAAFLPGFFAASRTVQGVASAAAIRSEEHTSELQSHSDLVCRLLLEKKKKHHR